MSGGGTLTRLRRSATHITGRRRHQVCTGLPWPTALCCKPHVKFLLRRRLHAAAKAGEAGVAEAVLLEMAAGGLLPGPRAYHALAVAYAKAGDAHAALSAVQRAARELGVVQQTRWQPMSCWRCCHKH